MKRLKGNKGLLDKKRFEAMERERQRRLCNMTMKEAVRLTEEMLSSELMPECIKQSREHRPICLKLSLERMRRAARQRRRRAALKGGTDCR